MYRTYHFLILVILCNISPESSDNDQCQDTCQETRPILYVVHLNICTNETNLSSRTFIDFAFVQNSVKIPEKQASLNEYVH